MIDFKLGLSPISKIYNIEGLVKSALGKDATIKYWLNYRLATHNFCICFFIGHDLWFKDISSFNFCYNDIIFFDKIYGLKNDINNYRNKIWC